MMSHPEHEDPAMADHDDERAERRTRPARMPTPLTKQEREVLERAEARLHERAVKALFESAFNALLDASDNAKAGLADLLEADAGFELKPEMEAAIYHLDLVKSRVAERLGYLEAVSGEPEDAPSTQDSSAGGDEDDRRLAGHPSEREALRESARSTLASRPIDLVEMHRLWAAEVSDEV